MHDIQAALSSLFDSLNSLFFRLAATDPASVRVSRIMLRTGETKQALGLNPNPAAAQTAFTLSGEVSLADPFDPEAIDELLSRIEQFLIDLTDV